MGEYSLYDRYSLGNKYMIKTEQWDADRLMLDFTEALEQVGTLVGLVEKESWQKPNVADAAIDIEIGGVAVRLIVEIKRSAYPRDVREAAYQLTRYLSEGPQNTQRIPILVSESISTGSREILREEGIGYFDSGGSLFMSARGVFVLIDKPVGRTAEKVLASAFVGRRALALQAVWSLGGQAFGVKEIAKRALVSPATASETLTVLDRHDWTSSMGSGPSKVRRLVNPRGLLDAWSDHQRAAKPLAMRRYFVPGTSAAELVGRLDDACRRENCRYAITGEAAAQVYAPYLSNISQVLCRLRPGPDADAVLHDLGARPVREGWNLGVIGAASDAEFVFGQERNSVCLASPLQTYLDLLQSSGRARELADHLRSECLEGLL